MKISAYLFFVLLLSATLFGCQRSTFSTEEAVTKKKLSDGNGNQSPCGFIDDRDCDGVTDNADNCPDTYNPDQADANANGIGDVCDNSNPPPTPTQTTGYVSAQTYLSNYCEKLSVMSYDCGMARGITEVLNETKTIFANNPVYDIHRVFFLVDSVGGNSHEVPTCGMDSLRCFVTMRSSIDDGAMRRANVSYLNGKLDYIEGLRGMSPALNDDYLNGYRAGCIQAYWFSSGSMPSFLIP